jgi:hypothetical protein
MPGFSDDQEDKAAPPQIPEGLQSLTVTCPEGIYGGDLLMVATPDGELELEVVVPDGIGPGDLFEVRPDPSLVVSPSENTVPTDGDIVSRMRAAIGLVDDLIERVEDYEIPKVVATVSVNQPPAGKDGGGFPPPPGNGGGSTGTGTGPKKKSPKKSSPVRPPPSSPRDRPSPQRREADAYYASSSDTAMLMKFYRKVEPGFATEEKVAQVLEIFRAKAEKIGRRAEWREIMYAKLRDKYGRDPRD